MDIHVARQPIFDRDYNVVAYELLYRNSKENSFDGSISDNVATSLLLLNSYYTFGIENLVGEARAFINFDKHLVHIGVPELLDKDRVTIEILETVNPDAKFMKEIRKLKSMGYTLAIDDYIADYPHEEILELVDLVKVDFSLCTQEDIEELTGNLKKRGKLLLAEKVENKEVYEWAHGLGFDYFQGFYFAKPAVQTQKTMNSSGVSYVRLMDELNNEEPDFRALSKIILMDVSLTYKLLKLVNANSKPISEITSVQQALAVLGVRQFRKWLSLAMVQNLSTRESSEAVKYALIRSDLLVKIAEASKLKKLTEELSLLGILSILDVVLEMNMEDALMNLPIGEEMKDTLLGKETKYSDVMKLCLAYEKGVFDEAEQAALNIGYELEQLPEHYVASISWAERTFIELQSVE